MVYHPKFHWPLFVETFGLQEVPGFVPCLVVPGKPRWTSPEIPGRDRWQGSLPGVFFVSFEDK